MPNYNVRIRDQIDASIPRKIRNIRDSAGGAAVSVRELRAQLQLVGRSSGSSLTGLQRSNDGVRRSAIGLTTAQNNLAISSNRLTASENSLAQRGLQLQAVNNRVTASTLAKSRTFDVTAISSTKLTASEQRAALAANRLAISNNRVRSSNLAVQLSEERLVRIKNENSAASVRETRSADLHTNAMNREQRAADANRRAEERLSIARDRNGRAAERSATATTRATVANRRSIGVIRSLILNIRNLLAVYGGFLLVSAVSEGLDTFRSTENRLKSVTTSAENLAAVQSRLNDIANETRTPVLALATSFQRYDRALSRVGASQQEVLDFTDTITKQLKIGGSTVAETESVIVQLGQALTKGNLDGEELRALRENAPIEVMEALADVLEVNVGQLKDLGREGRITTDVIREAFRRLRPETLIDFEELNRTLTESLTVFSNRFAEFLGRIEERTGVFTSLGNVIIFAGENLDSFANSLIAVGVGFAAFRGISAIVTSVGAFGSRMLFATGATNAATASTFSFAAAGRTLRTVLLTTGVGAIAVVIGLLVAYRNEIKVSEDGMVSLGDVMTVQWRRTTESVSNAADNITGFIADIFTIPQGNGFLESFNNLWIEAAFNAGALFNEIWEGARFGFDAFVNYSQQLWNSFLSFLTSATKVVIQSQVRTIARIADPRTVLGRLFTRTTGFKQSDILGLGNVATAGLDARIEQLDQANIELQKQLSDSANASDRRIADFENVLREDLDRKSEGFINEVRQVSEERIREEEKTNSAIVEAQEELNNVRVRSARTSEAEITSNLSSELRQRQKIAQELFVNENLVRAGIEQRELNQGVQEHFDLVNATQDAYESTRQEGNNFFRTLSEGYTNLISRASEFRQAAQASFTSAAQGLGAGLAGDRKGFGQFFAGLFNGFIQSRSADFNARLAAAGPGVASSQVRNQQNGADAARFDQIQSSASSAQPAVQGLNIAIQQVSQSLNSVNPSSLNQIGNVNAVQQVNSLRTAVAGLNEPLTQVQSSSRSLNTSLNEVASTGSRIGSISGSLNSVRTSATSTATSIDTIPRAFERSTQAVRSFASTAVSELRKVTEAANEAADAQNRVGSGGFGGGGGFLGGLLGFSSGGLVPGGEKIIRVNENGREFVMNNRATRDYLPILEAMNAGRFNASSPTPVPSTRSSNSSGGGSMSVVINNNAPGVTVREQQIGPGEVAIMIEQASEETYNRVASDFSNPNSAVARNFGQNYNAKRVY